MAIDLILDYATSNEKGIAGIKFFSPRPTLSGRVVKPVCREDVVYPGPKYTSSCTLMTTKRVGRLTTWWRKGFDKSPSDPVVAAWGSALLLTRELTARPQYNLRMAHNKDIGNERSEMQKLICRVASPALARAPPLIVNPSIQRWFAK